MIKDSLEEAIDAAENLIEAQRSLIDIDNSIINAKNELITMLDLLIEKQSKEIKYLKTTLMIAVVVFTCVIFYNLYL